jgi:subtilisin family serine protease
LGRSVAAAAVLGAIALVGSVASAAPPSDSVGSYIVVLRPDVANVGHAADALASANGGTVGFVYEHALRGFSVTVSPQGAAGIAHNPNVAYVEPDQLFTASAQNTPTGIGRIFADSNPTIGINGTDDTRVDVDVAVIDTGIDLSHPDLNVAGSINCAGGGPFSSNCGAGGADGNGHGTHVAGTIGALDNGTGVVGVAPGARLWAVRVLNNNGSGYTSWIVAGMDWVVAQGNIEVANMSLGGSTSQALDDAANNMANHGIAVAVAAGNSDADASTSSPARAANVLTVSALADFNGAAGGGAPSTCRTDQDDTLADFSNWGPGVEVAAPGVCIYSTWLNGGYNTISGTSMASPHAAGALALLASHSPNSTANPIGLSGVQTLYGVLETNGNFNWTDDSGDGIKEPLLAVSNTTVFNPVTVAGSGGGGGGSDTAPTLSITTPHIGDTVSGSTVPVTADASDDHGVTQVQFLVDGTSIGVDTDGSNGWSATWDTTTVTNATHALTAKTTDTIGQTTTSASVSVNVNNPVPPIQLTVRAYKLKGIKYADLSWTGATTPVDVHKDGPSIATVSTSRFTDGPLGKGSGTATYQVCAAGGTTTCSNAVTVVW